MNMLSLEKRTQILGMMVEGMSIRSISRLTGASKNTLVKLLADAGTIFTAYHDEHVRNLSCKRLQLDEIWSFVGCKEKNVTAEKKAEGQGDIWTWTAICADSKLIASWYIGDRTAETGTLFTCDLAHRLANRVQITTDGHRAYLEAMDAAFGEDVDYAMLVKIYGQTSEGQKRYSPGSDQRHKQNLLHWQPGHEASQHELCRAPEPFHAYGNAPLHTAHQWLLKKCREPRARAGDLLYALQLRAYSHDAAMLASYGGWGDQDPFVFGRYG